MTAPSEQDHVLQSLQDFTQLLHFRMPLLKHRHFSEFYSDEDQILETCRLVKVEVIQQFVAKISHLSDERSTELFKELSMGIRVKINDLLVKNGEHKNDCEAFLKRRIEDITDDIKSTMEVKLKLKLEVEVDAMEEILDGVVSRGMGFFDNYRHGNIEFFEDKKKNLLEALEELKREIMEKHLDQNSSPSSSNGDVQVRVEVQVQLPVPEEVQSSSSSSSSSSTLSQVASPSLEEASQMPHDNTSTDSESSDGQGHSPSRDLMMVQMKMEEAVDLVVHCPTPTPTPQRFTGSSGRKSGRPSKIKDGDDDNDGPGTSAMASSKRPKLNEAVNITPGTSSNSEGDVVPGNGSAGCDEAVVPQAKSYPLIFRLSTNSISMGTKVNDGTFLRLPCQQNGELSLPSVLAVDENGRVLFGAEAVANLQNPDDCDYWFLQHFLGDSSNPVTPEMVSFRVGIERMRRDMTLEFFLGLLLRNLKRFAECHLEMIFKEAVISVPIWLSSYHRIQIKDAGSIAGFTAVNLVNQEAVAACALIQGIMVSRPRGDILVLAENFGILSAIIYRYRPNTEDLEMIGDHHVVIDENMDSDIDLGSIERLQMIRDLRASLFRRADARAIKMKYVFLTESPEWLETFSMEYGRSEGSGAENLWGCGTLAGNIVQNIYDMVVEYLPKGLGLHLKGFMSQPRISLVDVVELQIPLETLFQGDGDGDGGNPKLFQGNVYSVDEPVPLGEIEFRGKSKYAEEYKKKAMGNCRLDLEFHIDSEGVVTLEQEDIKVVKIKKNGSEVVQVEDFNWSGFNMDGGKREEIRRVVYRICFENRIRLQN